MHRPSSLATSSLQRSTGGVRSTPAQDCARRYADLLCALMTPASVAHLAPTDDTWLRAFGHRGATHLRAYLARESELSGDAMSVDIEHVDLDKPIRNDAARPFDLAISLDAAQAIRPAAAPLHIETLALLADAVIFAGTRPHHTSGSHRLAPSSWARLFTCFGFSAYDFFRPVLWGDPRIPARLQQDTFLYARRGTLTDKLLHEAGCTPIRNLNFMDCVHADLQDDLPAHAHTHPA
jgi:hypothetical protein